MLPPEPATPAVRALRTTSLSSTATRAVPWTSKTVAQLLAELGVEKSLSRPYNSNENPYWEAQFKTMKYRPTYPGRFGSPEDAKAWTGRFLHWYNHSHYHTGLALMVPAWTGESR